MNRLAFLFVLTLSVPTVSAQDLSVRTLLLSDAGPGTGDGARFDKFRFPAVNDVGEVVFEGELTGPGVTSANDRGLWLVTRTGDLVLLAREGNPAPSGVPGAVFRSFIAPATINNNGIVVFEATVTGPGVDNGNNEGIYAASVAGLRPVALEGSPAPGFPGVSLGDPANVSGGLRYVALNDAGEVAFTARLTGPGVSFSNNEALYTGRPGSLTPVLREGAPAPPGAPSGTIRGVSDTPEILPDGTLAAGFGVIQGSTDRGVLALLNETGLDRVVAVEGEPSPSGRPFGAFNGFSANANRDVLFRDLGFTGGGTADDEIIAGRPGALRLVARVGDPVPGIPNRRYLSVAQHRLGRDGEIVYSGLVTPSSLNDNAALWATGSGVPQLVAWEGQPAPGGGAYAAPRDPVIGDGVVVFSDEPDFGGRIRLFVWTAEDGVRRLPFGTVEVAPGDFRSAEFIDYTEATLLGNEFGAGGAGEPQAINARGQFAFLARFTDGSYGLFLADLTAGEVLDLALTPLQTEVPAGGGPVGYTARGENLSDAAQNVDFWAQVTLPNGTTRPALGPVTVTLAPGASAERTLRQPVPRRAPAGTYTYTGFVGTFPDDPVAADAFQFIKLGRAAWADEPLPLLAFGLAIDEATGRAVQPGDAWTADAPRATSVRTAAAAVEIVAFPNPFATTATLRFDLPASGAVRLAVYDVLGREVARLLDGETEAGSHAVAFEAAALPSGVYVYRLAAGSTVRSGRVVLVR